MLASRALASPDLAGLDLTRPVTGDAVTSPVARVSIRPDARVSIRRGQPGQPDQPGPARGSGVEIRRQPAHRQEQLGREHQHGQRLRKDALAVVEAQAEPDGHESGTNGGEQLEHEPGEQREAQGCQRGRPYFLARGGHGSLVLGGPAEGAQQWQPFDQRSEPVAEPLEAGQAAPDRRRGVHAHQAGQHGGKHEDQGRQAETRSRRPIQASSRASTARASTSLGRTRPTNGSSSSTPEPSRVARAPGPGSSPWPRSPPAARLMAQASARRLMTDLARRAADSVQASHAQPPAAWPTASSAIVTLARTAADAVSPP